jgi:hypothetical protein
LDGAPLEMDENMARAGSEHEPADGTATFPLTEVVLASVPWEMAPEAATAIARHYELIEWAMRGYGAVRSDVTSAGHSVLSVFRSSAATVGAALAVQQVFAAEEWPAGLPIRVRVGCLPCAIAAPM